MTTIGNDVERVIKMTIIDNNDARRSQDLGVDYDIRQIARSFID